MYRIKLPSRSTIMARDDNHGVVNINVLKQSKKKHVIKVK